MLEYKAKWYGRTLIKVPQTYPSSQICCNCGYKNPKVKKLHVRKWECPECHTIQDRDMNASINILNKALKQA
jgi:putative transposase